ADEVPQRRRRELRRPEMMWKERRTEILHDALDQRSRRERAGFPVTADPRFAGFGQGVHDARVADGRQTSRCVRGCEAFFEDAHGYVITRYITVSTRPRFRYSCGTSATKSTASSCARWKVFSATRSSSEPDATTMFSVVPGGCGSARSTPPAASLSS